ncbi:MAG: serine hydrolase [Thermoanaerobaculia bacterium]
MHPGSMRPAFGALMLLTLFVTAPVLAAKAAAPVKDPLAGYDAFVDRMIRDWRIPGLAVAIVKEGKVVYARGFGYRDVEKKLPVTPDTLFAIASCTKAFTTFALGTLVDEGRLDWDKPVRTYLPGFEMYDPNTTAMITPRDLVTHRSGLPRHDRAWYNNKVFTRKDVVDRIRYLEPSVQLRTKWQYNNLMYVTAGYLMEQITGKSWEDNVRERIFAPLGMTRSNFSATESAKSPDFSQPYQEEDGKILPMPFYDAPLTGPAGSIDSSANDMAKWVQIHLSDGTVGGRRLINGATLADLHEPRIIIDAPIERPELSRLSYALGWFVDAYRGHERVSHGGNIDGFSSLVTLMPQDKLGMVVLTNMDRTEMPEILVRHTLDRFLELDPIDWNGEGLAQFATWKATDQEAKNRKTSARKPGTRPAHALEEYAGEYEHPAYGLLKLAPAGDHLEATFNDLSLPLEHWHYEVWSVKDGSSPFFANKKFLFSGDMQGNVASVAVDMEQLVKPVVFTKKPDARLSDPAYLARFVGEYSLAGDTFKVELTGSELTMTPPGEPPLHLVPGLAGRFTVREVASMTLSFVEDPQGNVTALDMIKQQGVYTMPRLKK